METKHKSVLLQSTIETLKPFTKGVYVDATLGGGGHSKEILAFLPDGSTMIVLDVDSQACNSFSDFIKKEYTNKTVQVKVINDNFKNIALYTPKNVVAIIADLGFSTDQLEGVNGLSFLKKGELDMRMDQSLKIKAKDLLNGLYLDELEKLFLTYGDFSFARKLAKEICKQRTIKLFETTYQLNSLIRKIVPFSLRKGNNKHPEAKVYQALRIAVNDEINTLSEFLKISFDLLGPGGKLAIITFHSGEDRIVKKYFRSLVDENKAEFIVEKLKPSEDEIQNNKNSRSAHLRVIKKI